MKGRNSIDLPLPLSRRLRADTVALKRRGERLDRGLAVFEGVRLVLDVLGSETIPFEYCLLEDGYLDSKSHLEIWDTCVDRGLPVYRASAEDMRLCSSTRENQGVLAVGKFVIPVFNPTTLGVSPGPVTILVDASDPGNVGTVIRTCDWFGASSMILAGTSVDATNPKVIRATMGSCARVEIFTAEDSRTLLSECRGAGYTVILTVANGGRDLRDVDVPKRSVIVFGSEAHGLSAELQDRTDTLLTIPGRGGAESLNLATSHAVVLGHLWMKSR